jgi:hypothetical protein
MWARVQSYTIFRMWLSRESASVCVVHIICNAQAGFSGRGNRLAGRQAVTGWWAVTGPVRASLAGSFDLTITGWPCKNFIANTGKNVFYKGN